MSDSHKRRPLPLVRNIRYPTYQLWAIAGGPRNLEAVLKICILQTMQWLRKRFREHDLPKELDFPSSDEYSNVDFSQFSNILIRSGHQLEILPFMNAPSE